jgi:uncharacterized RDD family membrane protein YckC
MSEVDPYAPPKAPLIDLPADVPDRARRGRRFLARLVDNILLSAVWAAAVLVATMGLGYEMVPDGTLVYVCYGLAFVIVFPFQAYFLFHDGQSLSKKLLNLRIVRPDGSRADAVRVIFIREMLPPALSFVPLIGPLFGFADALFIFGPATRCLHDYLADTIVIDLRDARQRILRLGTNL